MTNFLRTLSSSLVTILVTKFVRSLVARLYETVTTVPGSWVRWRAVFLNDSRVLKRCSESFLIYIYCIQCDFSTKSKYGDKKVKYWSMNLVMNLVIWSNSSFKSCLNFKFKILTKPCAQSLNKSLTLWPNLRFQICNKLLPTWSSSSTSATVTTSKFWVVIFKGQSHINQVY